MLRGLLGLLIAVAAVVAAWSLYRRAVASRRGPSVRELVESKPAELPAPEEGPASAPEGVLSERDVFVRLHALAFGIAPQDTPAAQVDADLEAATRAALPNAVNEPRYAP